MHAAYYSLIQYCPDPSRAEALNVGLVLLRPAVREVHVRTIPELPELALVFGLSPRAMQGALDAARRMETRIRRESFATIEEFEHFVASRGHEIQLTRPRSMNATLDLAVALERMFEELVSRPLVGNPEQHADPARKS